MMVPPPEFFLACFFSVAWALTVYLAYHAGRNLESRQRDAADRRRMASVYNERAGQARLLALPRPTVI